MVRPRAPAGIFAAQLCRRPSVGPGWTSGVSAHGAVTGVNNGGGKPFTGKEPWSVRVRSYSLETLETAESFIHLCSSPSRHAPEILAYLHILTASAPDWLCCAVLCEMVTMDRSTAPSQYNIAVDSPVAFPNHLSISSASASAHCSGSDLLKWQQAERTLGEEQYGHACTPPHPPKAMNAVDLKLRSVDTPRISIGPAGYRSNRD